MSAIYKITNKVNGKSYIGKTIYEPNQYIENHFKNAVKSKDNRYFYNSIRRYGRSSFEYSFLYEGISSNSDLSTLEKFFIKKYKSDNNKYGYNMTSGGEGGQTCSRQQTSINSKKMWDDKGFSHKKYMSNMFSNMWLDDDIRHRILSNRKKSTNNLEFIQRKIKATTGENNPNAHFSNKELLDILKLMSNGWSNKHLANIYNIRTGYFNELRRGNTRIDVINKNRDIFDRIKLFKNCQFNFTPVEIQNIIDTYKVNNSYKTTSIIFDCNPHIISNVVNTKTQYIKTLKKLKVIKY